MGAKDIRKIDEAVRQRAIEERSSSHVARIQIRAVCHEQPNHLIQACDLRMKVRHQWPAVLTPRVRPRRILS